MIRSAASKVMWVGRATVFLVGLSVILALVLGVASTALGANGQNFILGKLNNAATKVTGLVGNVDGAAALRVTNPNSGTNDTALDLRVQAGEAPMKVNSNTRVANLNAATAGRADTATSAQNATNAQNAANAQNADQLDGKDSSVFLRDTYREQTELTNSPTPGSEYCATTDYTPAHPQTALIDINASLAAGTWDVLDAFLMASVSTDGGTTWTNTSYRLSPQVDISPGRDAALGYLDAYPLQPGVTYRFAAEPLYWGTADKSHCQVLVTFINR